MGLVNLFGRTVENNDSPLPELLDEDSNETSDKESVPKTKGMKCNYVS